MTGPRSPQESPLAQPPEGGRSPLDEQIAQVREARDWLWRQAENDAPPHGWKEREELIERFDAALSVIEQWAADAARHLHDMEKLIEAATYTSSTWKGGRRQMPLAIQNLDVVLAALSAAPTATHQETK